jgi:hypothetical protein
LRLTPSPWTSSHANHGYRQASQTCCCYVPGRFPGIQPAHLHPVVASQLAGMEEAIRARFHPFSVHADISCKPVRWFPLLNTTRTGVRVICISACPIPPQARRQLPLCPHPSSPAEPGWREEKEEEESNSSCRRLALAPVRSNQCAAPGSSPIIRGGESVECAHRQFLRRPSAVHSTLRGQTDRFA